MKTTEMVKRYFTEVMKLDFPNEVLDEEVFESTLDELSLTDDEPFDKTMVDDVAYLYPEILDAKQNWADENRDLF